jgi:hypothetical protein
VGRFGNKIWKRERCGPHEPAMTRNHFKCKSRVNMGIPPKKKKQKTRNRQMGLKHKFVIL